MNKAVESDFKILTGNTSSELIISSDYDLTGGLINIVNTMGMLVMQIRASHKIDVSSLTSGVYTLVFTKDGITMIRRFIKS